MRRRLTVRDGLKLVLGLSLCWGMAFSARAAEVELPLDLSWCEELPTVADKLKMKDLSDGGIHFLADGEYTAPGFLYGYAGNYTVRFLEVGEQSFLTEVEFRIFRLEKAWNDILSRMTKMLGEGETEVVAKANYGPDGETLVNAERWKTTWLDPDGNWEAVARQMSNEIDMVKISYELELCRPEEEEVAEEPVEEKKGDPRGGDIFDYDPYADDPLHEDKVTQKKEDDEEKKEEEEKEEEDKTEIDWDDSSDDSDIDW